MLCFFHMTKDIAVTVSCAECAYRYNFQGSDNKEQVPLDRIHVTTPSQYQRICQTINESGINDKEVCRLLSPSEIISHELMPKLVSFSDSIEDMVNLFPEKDTIRIAITNAVSNAIGDYLIGINAFNVFQKELKKQYPDKKFVFNLFQLNPQRMLPISRQWKHLYDQIGTMPINLKTFFSHDAYMDFGGLITFEGFDNQPMFDFFLDAFCMKNTNVPPEQKRLKYTTTQATDTINEILMKHIRKRSQGKEIVMVHPFATTAIRTMPHAYAIDLIEELKRRGYFTVSAMEIPTRSKNHMNLHNFSTEIDDFAGIIKAVDGIITVDTATSHIADCFSKPTLTIFTSIDPRYRVPYYPNCKGIMIEKPDGMFYGKHKFESGFEQKPEVQDHIKKIWSESKVDYVVDEFEKLMK